MITLQSTVQTAIYQSEEAMFVNYNGRIREAEDTIVPFDNRAFRYGFGLVETMLVKEGSIRLADLHWGRLFDAMITCGLKLPAHFSKAMLQEEVQKTVQKNNLERLARVRLQIFPGCGGINEELPSTPDFLIEVFSLELSVIELNTNGLVVGLAQDLQKNPDRLSALKTSNVLLYAMAAQQAKANKWNDALICNARENIVESSISNIFWIKDEVVYTPPLSEGCIAGTMRSHLLNILPSIGLSVREEPLTISRLQEADEAFLSNAIRGIKWISSFGDTAFCKKIVEKAATLID